MKKIFTLLAAFMVVLSTAQTTPSFKTIKLTGTTAGGTNDSVLTIGTDNVVKKVAKSVITDGLATNTQLATKENTITSGTNLEYFRGDKTWQTLNTAVVPESGNLYYTNARARAALSFTGGAANYNATTGVITIPTATNQLINNSGFITGLTFAAVTAKPTTLSGYGITDAQSFIAPGTISQYWRGDKTWQTLDKASVGLGNVDNTSDADKPVSTATQTALDAKQATLVSGTSIKTINGNSLLGSGDITISGGGSTAPLEFNTTDLTVWNNGKGNIATNTSFGEGALKSNTASQNTAVGVNALTNSTNGGYNTAMGTAALASNTSGGGNVGIGVSSLFYNQLGSGNVAVGRSAGALTSGNANMQRSDFSVFVGNDARSPADNQTNQIVIGSGAVGTGSNSATLGNASITLTRLRGQVNMGSIKLDAMNTAPDSATATGTVGEIRVTATHIYVCTATNTWVRTALTTW